MIQKEASGGKDISTAKSIIHSLGRNLSTLNMDTADATQRMPSILPREKGVTSFIGSLQERGFSNLAGAFATVHAGETKSRKGKQFPSEKDRKTYEAHSRVVSDLATAIADNAYILDLNTRIGEGEYRGEATRNGELVLTFYESVLQSLSDETIASTAQDRARTLANHPGFTLSPLMEQVLERDTVPTSDITTAKKWQEIATHRRETDPSRSILAFVYGYEALRAGGSSDYYLNEKAEQLSDLEARRQRFIAFSEREGLADINSQHDLIVKVNSMIPDPTVESPAQVFERLAELKEHARTASNLITAANDSIRVRAVLATDQFNGRRLSDITRLDERQAFNSSLYDRDIHSQSLPYASGVTVFKTGIADIDTPLTITPESLVPYQKEAVDFSRHKEGVITEFLYSVLASATADYVGRDITTGNPVIFEEGVDTFEQAQRFSRPLPEGLTRLMDRGLRDMYVSDYGHLEFYDGTEEIGRVASTFLPDGTNDPAFQELNGTIEGMRQASQAWQEDRDSEELKDRYYQLRRQSRKELLGVRRRIFDEVVDAFSQTTQTLHPRIERQAREAAVYALSTGEGWKSHGGFSIVQGHDGQPLSQSVHAMRQLAYKEGVYLDPLKKEMAEKLIEWGLNPNHIADIVQQALDNRSQGSREIFTGSVGQENWFVVESLFAVSTIDRQGNYTDQFSGEERRRLRSDEERRPEATEELIEHLRWLGK